jgi:hypothetical protein
MTLIDIVTKILIPLLAALIGAILAFRYQYHIELKRDKRVVLQNLMIYRNVGANEMQWINSINSIDIVFNKDARVRELYHTFLAQTRHPFFENKQYIETFYQLLFAMGQCSGYKHLTMLDIRDYYAPEALNMHYPNMRAGNELLPPSSAAPPQTS